MTNRVPLPSGITYKQPLSRGFDDHGRSGSVIIGDRGTLVPEWRQRFHKALDEALTEARRAKNWNEAFRRAVADRGIALVEGLQAEGIDDASWLVAPPCIVSQSGGWPRQTLLVFNPDFKRKRPR